MTNIHAPGIRDSPISVKNGRQWPWPSTNIHAAGIHGSPIDVTNGASWNGMTNIHATGIHASPVTVSNGVGKPGHVATPMTNGAAPGPTGVAGWPWQPSTN